MIYQYTGCLLVVMNDPNVRKLINMAKRWYQIIFNLGGSCRSYKYFQADEQPEEAAKAVADMYIEDAYANQRWPNSFKAPKTLQVVEYDNETKAPVRKSKAHRFKLHLTYLDAKASNGVRMRQEWYEFVE